MPSVIIIGASRGIGCELARQYLLDGWTVHATSRDGEIPSGLKGVEGALTMHPMDVRDKTQIAAMVNDLGSTPIDVLIVAAGTYDKEGGPFGNGPAIPAEKVFAINTEAPMNIAQALYQNLIAAPLGRMIFISSAEGIRAGRRKRSVYGRSKALLNDQIRAYCDEWAADGVIGIALHPGWVATDMGGTNGPVSPEQSASGIRMIADGLTPEHSGVFLDFRGNTMPW